MTQSKPMPVVLENVHHLIETHVNEDERAQVLALALAIYRTVSEDDLLGRSDSNIYGGILSLWHSLKQTVDEQVITVFDPEIEKHGWKSSHTIVQILMDDMPFMVDSVRMALNRLGITSHLLLHCPLYVQRDEEGRLITLTDGTSSELLDAGRETVFFIEIDRQGNAEAIDNLKRELEAVMADIKLMVADWQPMQAKLQEVIDSIEQQPYPGSKSELKESMQFIRWIADHNFTLMGYRHYDLKAIDGDYELTPNRESSLGLMKQDSDAHSGRRLSSLTNSGRALSLSNQFLVLTQSNSKSRVHRPAYIDYIGVKRFNEQGEVIGEERFIGLYASTLYNNSAMQVPMLKEKVKRILRRSKLSHGSHAYKSLMNVLETYPRDELIQSTEEELLEVGMGVLQMQERDMTRLFVRKDVFGRFFSCMVYVTKDRYNTQLRKDSQKILKESFGSLEEVEFTTYFSESVLARTYYMVRVLDSEQDIDVKQIEQNLREAARGWDDKLQTALDSHYGESEGKKIGQSFAGAFAPSYREANLPPTAVVDISHLLLLNDKQRLGMLFYRPQEHGSDSQTVSLKLFHRNEPIHLSDVMPVLENMGLRVVGERPYEVKTSNGDVYWILEFNMLYRGHNRLILEKCQERFQEAFAGVWYNRYEDDGFNRLVLATGLTGRDVAALRAYAKYMRQIGSTFSQRYIEQTLTEYPKIAALLISLFHTRFQPELDSDRRQRKSLQTVQHIEDSLEQVMNLDDDRIIRAFLELILATLRTNYFQFDGESQNKDYLSFKIAPDQVSEMPLPLPKYEIFVYSPRVEGVHLRGGKVARGGLRWSDRREDFRTEVLGLVKAQQVKNTVIVPVGAKGGFVCKMLSNTANRDQVFEEGKACYSIFIRALLDVTDNIKQGELVYPARVVRHDDDDPYLVVAADKGTATFSDIANGIADEYGFWLSDAFASGGSVGYDHKKMGITAKGAWESVKRHFREIGIDCQNETFTCVGIGDMAGDVFGNGMLLSRHIQLVAAFNHMHIFFDPEPDAASSFEERKRLFELPRSSWADYDFSLISEGGGVFSRAAKSIDISEQMKAKLGIASSRLTPNELIKHILQMQVDLLWNGGIGTYVKAKDESHADVGDRANDQVRVNGCELNAKIVGEGGNLGLTQRGRIEYAIEKSGRLNTDFIDNVGGVDCSDNEVNIKILLNQIEADGDLTRKQRNQLLYDMTGDVEKIVLNNCYRQTMSLSITQAGGNELIKEQVRFIHHLEKQGILNRALENIPSDEVLAERQAAGQSLSRPEMSVLLAYAKMMLKEELKAQEITGDDFFAAELYASFPEVLQERFRDRMDNHPLRGEIIATRIANMIVNEVGLNFVNRMKDETGAPIYEIAICYTIAREVFAATDTWQWVIEHDNRASASIQAEMLLNLRRTARRATRWFLRHRNRNMSIRDTIDFYRPAFENIDSNMQHYLVADEVEALAGQAQQLVDKGVDALLANTVVRLSTQFSALDIAQIAELQQRDIDIVSDIYFNLGARLELHWFLEQITEQPVANHWQALARASFREELDWQQRALTLAILRYCKSGCDANSMIDMWVEDHRQAVERWLHMLSEFRTSAVHEYAKFSVALRELMLLSHTSDPLQ